MQPVTKHSLTPSGYKDTNNQQSRNNNEVTIQAGEKRFVTMREQKEEMAYRYSTKKDYYPADMENIAHINGAVEQQRAKMIGSRQ